MGEKELLKALDLIEKEFSKKAKSFVNKQAKELKNMAKDTTDRLTTRRTGKLVGKIVVKSKSASELYNEGSSTTTSVYDRVVSSQAPHAHLIEYGHAIRGHRKKVNGKRQRRGYTRLLTKNRARAFMPIEKSIQAFRPTYESEVEKFVYKMISKLDK